MMSYRVSPPRRPTLEKMPEDASRVGRPTASTLERIPVTLYVLDPGYPVAVRCRTLQGRLTETIYPGARIRGDLAG